MRFIQFIVGFALLAILAAAGFGYWVYSTANTPVAHTKAEEYITVEKGSTPTQIISKLTSQGIIKSPVITQIYLRVLGDASKFKAGDYKFKSPISPVELFKELETGKERTIKLTIPEGWTRFDISKRIAANFLPESPMSEEEVLDLMDDTSQIRDFDPTAKNLEGYLYPTTYEFPLDATPKDVIKRLVSEFRQKWKPEWTLRANEIGKSPRQIVTIASLIENESKVDSERKIVSSVIYNRLDRGMALGIDATNVYIAKMRGKWDGVINKSDIDFDSPYNTRKISGLPPGPISSASESALEAALNPDKTDYLYYVLNVEKNDGSHNFYESAAEFERGKAQYQRWLSTQRKK